MPLSRTQFLPSDKLFVAFIETKSKKKISPAQKKANENAGFFVRSSLEMLELWRRKPCTEVQGRLKYREGKKKVYRWSVSEKIKTKITQLTGSFHQGTRGDY